MEPVRFSLSDFKKWYDTCISIDERNEKHQTPLHVVAEKDKLKYAKMILKKNPNVNATDVNGNFWQSKQ